MFYYVTRRWHFRNADGSMQRLFPRRDDRKSQNFVMDGKCDILIVGNLNFSLQKRVIRLSNWFKHDVAVKNLMTEKFSIQKRADSKWSRYNCQIDSNTWKKNLFLKQCYLWFFMPYFGFFFWKARYSEVIIRALPFRTTRSNILRFFEESSENQTPNWKALTATPSCRQIATHLNIIRSHRFRRYHIINTTTLAVCI